MALLGVLISPFDYNVNSISYIIILSGIIVFQLASTIIMSFPRYSYNKKNRTFKISENSLNIVFAIELIILSIGLIQSFLFILNNFNENFYFTLKNSTDANLFINSSLFGYFSIFSISFTVFNTSLISVKTSKKRTFAQIIIGFSFAFLSLGRTLVLMLLISIVVMYSHKKIKKISPKSIIYVGLLFLVVFFIYQILKYPYLLQEGQLFSFLFEGIIVYLSGSIVALEKWFSNPVDYLYGKNILRFFIEIMNAIGGNLESIPLVQPGINIGDNYSTNVYSIFYFYISDFGVIYMLITMSFLGYLQSILFINRNRSD